MRSMHKVALFLSAFFACASAHAYTFRCDPVGRHGTRSSSRQIFADKKSTLSYKVSIMSGTKELARKFYLRGLTIVKANQQKRFHFAIDEVAERILESVPGRSVQAIYITCCTDAVDDNWKDVGGDWSRGLVPLGAVIEIADEDGKIYFVWSNQSGPYKRGIAAALKDQETTFQNSRDDYNWRRYVRGKDRGYNYWRLQEED